MRPSVTSSALFSWLSISNWISETRPQTCESQGSSDWRPKSAGVQKTSLTLLMYLSDVQWTLGSVFSALTGTTDSFPLGDTEGGKWDFHELVKWSCFSLLQQLCAVLVTHCVHGSYRSKNCTLKKLSSTHALIERASLMFVDRRAPQLLLLLC